MMITKQKIADSFVNMMDGWNHALHNAVERKIDEAYDNMFSPSAENRDEMIKTKKGMREFYYARMVNTASLFLTGISVLVALVALIVAIIAIHYS